MFVQLLRSSLQLTPHLRVLVPEALWQKDRETVEVPSPTEEEMNGILRRLLRESAGGMHLTVGYGVFARRIRCGTK